METNNNQCLTILKCINNMQFKFNKLIKQMKTIQ